jgi:hypothetical protein
MENDPERNESVKRALEALADAVSIFGFSNPYVVRRHIETIFGHYEAGDYDEENNG